MKNLFCKIRRRLRWRVSFGCRLILSAGMPRSGSTWLYNAARLLLRRSASVGDDLASGWIGDWPRLPRQGTTLLKLHEFDAPLVRRAAVVLYSYRDIRDALASSKRKFGTEPTLDLAQTWIADDRRWRRQADYIMRYETMQADPLAALAKLVQALEIDDVRPQEVLAEIAKLDAGERTYHPENLLHHGHITDGRHGSWQGWLPEELLREIEKEFADWLTANNYYPGSSLTLPAR